MQATGAVGMSGGVGLKVVRGGGAAQVLVRNRWVPPAVAAVQPRESGLGAYVRTCLKYLPAHMAAELLARVSRTVVLESALRARVFRGARYRWWAGVWDVSRAALVADFGVVSQRVVTTAGVNFLVDAFQGTVEPELFRYHGVGTGTNAEATGDTALQTELTTQYNPDSTRATGTLAEGASANIFQTVGTNTFDASVAITEHGIFTQAATGGGTLLDRSVFSVINLGSGDSLQTTYELTCSAGG